MSPIVNASAATPVSRRGVLMGAAAAALMAATAISPAGAAPRKVLPLTPNEQVLANTIRKIDASTARLNKEGAAADARGAAADARGAAADNRSKCWDVLIDAKNKGFQFTGEPDRNDPCGYARSNGLKVSSL